MSAWERSFVASFAVLGCACTGATEILVVVDTDVEGVDELAIEVRDADGELQVADALLADRAPPRRLVLRHAEGALGPIALRVEARANGALVASTERVAHFREGSRIELPIVLPASCRELVCSAGQVCGNFGECRAPDVDDCEYDGCDAGPPRD